MRVSPSRTTCVEELAAAIVAVQFPHPTRVAVDGVDGSGKSTLADELVEPLRRTGRKVIRASIDGFHNPRAVRYFRGSDSPEGYFRDSFDYAALQRELLEPMGPKGSRKFRTAVFDYRTDRAVDTPPRVAADHAVLLFDGVFLQRPELEGLWDLTVWVDAPFDITVERAIARDVGNGGDARVTRGKYASRYVPGQQLYMRECRPRERADILFGNAYLEHPTVRLVHAKARPPTGEQI